MTTSPRNEQHQDRDAHQNPPPGGNSRRVPVWQALFIPVVSILTFFLLLEGALALFGVKPGLETQDPFVGYAADSPLFVPSMNQDGIEVMATAPNKRMFFNQQSFPRIKGQNTFRIFTLGGSTTFGRPYDDATSFSGWLRQLLTAADQQKHWEVINAGGVSYASYRVAHLMRELVQYQPDLFIVYTGHNEFLEERTYGQIRKIPPVIRSLVTGLAKTRTWSAVSQSLEAAGIQPNNDSEAPNKLAGEVNAILDQSIGLERYKRDDDLKANVLGHYRISLERIIAQARAAGTEVIFVTPASSLKDCSPFKSEDTDGLDPATREKTHKMLTEAKGLIRQDQLSKALDLLDAAKALNPRHAEIQYRRGQVLFALGRPSEAEAALRLARDEDVCPLRALTPMATILAEVAREQDVTLIDYVGLLKQRMQELKGHSIPGAELFLDHVHPNLEGHKILALALMQSMVEAGWVDPGPGWGPDAIRAVSAEIESGVDREAQGQALANLARVLSWAKKYEDAARSARQAMMIAGEFPQVAADSASILASIYIAQGQPERIVDTLYATLERAPHALELHLKLGEVLFDPPFEDLEKTAAHLLLVCQGKPSYGPAHTYYGLTMGKRGRPLVAFDSVMEALTINPNDTLAQKTLAWLRPQFGNHLPEPQRPLIQLERYPSMAPRKLVQLRRNPAGQLVPHGIVAEFHENGRLKYFADVSNERQNGVAVTWDESGREQSRIESANDSVKRR